MSDHFYVCTEEYPKENKQVSKLDHKTCIQKFTFND